jgi:hypothetical protein
VSSEGVGLRAKGYSFASRFSTDRGGRTKSGGYVLFVVVVVVTVFVSTHSASSMCSLVVRREIVSSFSSHPNAAEFSGVIYPSAMSPRRLAFDFDMRGVGDPSGAMAAFVADDRVRDVEPDSRVLDGRRGGSMPSDGENL